MKIAKVQLKNVLGIKSLEFDAGRFNEISGSNGTGKTSVLEAIKSIFEGGNDATLLRKGEERGEIVLVFDEGTTIKRRLTEKTNTVTVEKDGVRADKPQQTINALRDMLSVNPVAFLQADDKKRVDVFLESMPLKVDPDRIREIVGDPAFTVDESKGALAQIDEAYDTIFAERRDTNRAVTQKEATINQLAQTLPAEDPAAGGGEQEIEAQIADLDSTQEAEMQRIDTKLGSLRAAHDTEVGALQEEIGQLQARISQLQQEIATKREAFNETTRRADGQRSISTGRWRDARQPLVDQLNLIRSNRDAAVRAQTTRETMRGLRAETDQLQEDAERMSRVLRDLQAYKSKMLDELPIPGLTVEEGVLKRNGVAFDRLNEGQRVEIAFEIAALRAGDMGVVCVDGIELLDKGHYEAFKERALASGLQLFVTRVSNDDGLQISAA